MSVQIDQAEQARIKALLDDSLQDIDAATLSRLNQARQRALQLGRSQRRSSWRRPTLGLALASALLLLLVPGRAPPPVAEGLPETSLSPLEIALLSDAEDLDLVENLEFYAWLELEEDWDGSS
jgi:hypothetical protein